MDASQEMVALGVCNLLGSFVQSMPTTGSFSRTAVNSASGVKTPLGGIYTGALVLLCLAFLMPYCAFIPRASLAAVILTAVIFSLEYEVVRPIWSSKSRKTFFFYISNIYQFSPLIYSSPARLNTRALKHPTNIQELIFYPASSASLLDFSPS